MPDIRSLCDRSTLTVDARFMFCPDSLLAERIYNELCKAPELIEQRSVRAFERSELPGEVLISWESGHRVTMYIDPGTGSMLFSIIIGVTATGVFLVQSLIVKLKFSLLGDRVKDADTGKIPYVIFGESKKYWNVFKPICDEFERRKTACQFWTTSRDDPAFSEKYKFVKPVFIGEGNKAFSRLNLMNADVCLATTPGLDVLQWKRSKNVRKYVHVFHAIDAGNSYRMFGLDYYDAVLLTGSFSEKYIRELEELRGLEKKELVVTGSTYMDALYAKKQSMAEAKEDKTVPTVLLAPSWGPSSTLNRFGERIISSLLDTGYNVIIRPHPQSETSDPELMAKLKKQFPDSERLHWDFERDNFGSLNAADVMISDFSGVMLDYTFVFDRPLLYLDTSYDSAPYDSAWSKLPFWTFEVLPKLGRSISEADFGDLRSVIDDMLSSPVWKHGRDEVRSDSWEHIGEAAGRVADYLIKEEKPDGNLPV